jgi:diguanylate cyclase (GGDEF)-like protein
VTDGLTGLFNHRYFQEKLEDALNVCSERSVPCCVVLLDIDYFKKYNDTFGHPEGDNLLKQLSVILRQNTRETDLVARYGGEEFVIVLPNTSTQKGKEITERILDQIRQYPFKGYEQMPKGCVTVSAGIACFPTDGEHKALLIERADHALYKAKEMGRDQVVLSCEYRDDGICA